MSLKRTIVKSILQHRCVDIDNFRSNPLDVQRRVFRSLMKRGSATRFGREYAIGRDISPESFAQSVPLFDYDSFKPYIEKMLLGESDVTAPGVVKMFARSSGTTSDRSKYIPITERNFRHNHMRGMYDVSAIYNSLYPKSKILDGKLLTLGGTSAMERGYLVGDLSGLLIEKFKIGNGWFRLPKIETAQLANFDEKCERICRECSGENVTSFAGVPSWNLALMSRVLEFTGKSNLREVWPNLELFIHGGIEMTPYRRAFGDIDGGELRYMETFNASEGFFAIADDLSRDDMLLMLDYDIYYEFRQGDVVVPLEGVKVGEVYALLITSSNGLWRYEIGDTVMFTSTAPYRIRFAGRTRQFINAFGEEVIAENSDRAIVEASRATGAVVCDYMVAPRFMELDQRGCHQWLVEFVKEPSDFALFTSQLDSALREINSDYDAKRSSTLSEAEVHMLPEGTFVKWLSHSGRNKVPHLSNNRVMIEPLLEWAHAEEILNIK